MLSKRHLFKATKKLFKQFFKQSVSAIKKQIIWLVRTIFQTRKKRSSVNAGFVLPTVAMVALVVVLLTTAILFRSFDRAKSASNVRVNEAVLNAATPAVDRARAKISKLFQDGRLPRATPTDEALYNTLTNNINEYTFGDETKLRLISGSDEIGTAWRFPVDTDNNGKFDSYTLYGIYFKNPPTSSSQYTRARNSLEARTPPMTVGSVNGDCGDTLGTSATLVGSSGWFKVGNKLKKAFYVYTATVPITSTQTGNYEAHKGSNGFSALEYEQDRVQLPLVNNAVVYEDDIDLSPGPAFKLNGRVFTNSNFFTGSDNGVKLYQVSSTASCFYDADNAKIVIGGNLGSGGILDNNSSSPSTEVHLFKGAGVNPSTGAPTVDPNISVDTDKTYKLAYNSLAYVQRINRLVTAQMANATTTDPSEVTNGIQQQKTKLGLASYTTAENNKLRQQQLELYFKKRTRRIPYIEVDFGGDALGNYKVGGSQASSLLQGSGDTLRPPDVWIYPTDPTDGKTVTNYSKLPLKYNASDSTKLLPSATEPNKLDKTYSGIEQRFGDRVVVGNNLPQLWWKSSKFVGPNTQDTQDISGIKWDDPDDVTRTRRSGIETLADLGSTERDQDWELAAAKIPTNLQDPVGGLRVITGAGIYLPKGYTVTGTATDTDFATVKANAEGIKIWSDLMPVASSTATAATTASQPDARITLPDSTYTPYLRMRATAVYHYKATSYNAATPTPIACISSYYDPTNSTTAKNISTLPFNNATGGRSNNGIVYPPPTGTVSTYQNVLNYQAQLKYDNGRWVNKPLLDALAKTAANRTIAEQSAIDTAICALEILVDPTTFAPTPPIPHGAIQETAFLDARQVKAIQTNNTTTDYDLAKQDRQPLEIRATVLNLGNLRTTTIGTSTPAQEYLLPNSGIIYATRDDALLDLSAAADKSNATEAEKLESPVDYKLDPTRRPNAIMLVNGAEIGRETNYRDAEKGLILATNLPAYIKGNFNLHTKEEFTTALVDDWGNFYTRTAATRDPNFACRPNDSRLPNCTTGDKWRSGAVLADSISLLSNNFRLGFRDEGGYDFNNNLGNSGSITAFKNNGFFTNAYGVNANWYNSDYPKDLEPTVTIQSQTFQGSTYLNNFATPIQRRKNAPEYLMEVCNKIPVSACDPATDWWVRLPNGVDPGLKASNINFGTDDFAPLTHKAGTTSQFPTDSQYLLYPRRVAFKRLSGGALVLDTNTPPLPTIIGIKGGKINQFPLGSFSSSNRPDSRDNALWFKTTTANNDDTSPKLNEDADPTKNPRLVPVLQNEIPIGTDETTSSNVRASEHNNWLQVATETTFNLITAAGDTPARSNEDNGGLHNFVRFMENWNPETNPIKARISGTFIQVKRSAYATAPFSTSLETQSNDFKYKIAGNNSRTPFYLAPARQWGYDVALLSQSPDLFAQKLVIIPDDLPDEYYREVARDDAWIKTLLCGKDTKATPDTSDDTYAIDQNQRPTSCQS